MTLSQHARMTIDREHELDDDERAVVSETLDVMFASAARRNLVLPDDDRAVEVEAAIINLLLAGRGR